MFILRCICKHLWKCCNLSNSKTKLNLGVAFDSNSLDFLQTKLPCGCVRTLAVPHNRDSFLSQYTRVKRDLDKKHWCIPYHLTQSSVGTRTLNFWDSVFLYRGHCWTSFTEIQHLQMVLDITFMRSCQFEACAWVLALSAPCTVSQACESIHSYCSDHSVH